MASNSLSTSKPSFQPASCLSFQVNLRRQTFYRRLTPLAIPLTSWQNPFIQLNCLILLQRCSHHLGFRSLEIAPKLVELMLCEPKPEDLAVKLTPGSLKGKQHRRLCRV